MKKILLTSALTVGLGLGFAVSASALPFGDGGTALQVVFDGITVAPVLGDSSVDVTTDEILNDSYWSVGGSGGSFNTIVIEQAGFSGVNTFGVYDFGNPSSMVQIFDGASGAGSNSALSIYADGSVWVGGVDSGVDFGGNQYGYYLGTPGASAYDGFWYSDTSLNGDGFDHMGTYQGVGDTIEIPPFAAGIWGPSEYILAWEDLALPAGDGDFTDFVVLVESVNPMEAVPEPATMILLGSGLAGIAGLRFRRKKK